MSKGCDHSNGGVKIGAALKAAGYVGVFRYACLGRSDVNITADEVQDLRNHGIQIAIVNEHQAGYLLGGYNTGYNRAIQARGICRSAGLEDGVIYMAGDSEVLQENETNRASVATAMRGCGDAIGKGNTGFYGSYYMIDYLVSHEPWIQYYWQTVAWSNRNIHPRACALQLAERDYVGGVELDVNVLYKEDWGQRGYIPTEGDSMAIAVTKNEAGQLQIFVEKDTGEVKTTWKTDPDKGGDGNWNRDKQGNVVWQSLGKP